MTTTYAQRINRKADESLLRALREEYEDQMKQGRIQYAHNVLAARDRLLLRLQEEDR